MNLHRIAALALAFGWTASATAAEHPCDQLSNNSALGEIWPDEFARLVKDLAPKPKGAFVKTSEYLIAEESRKLNVATKFPMFAVVSKGSWGEFTYDADTELLRLKSTSFHLTQACDEGKYCTKLFGWGDEPTGQLEHSRDLSELVFKIPPGDIERISNTEQPIFYYVVSAKYPFAVTAGNDNLKVDLHCAALVSDDDSSIRDNNDRLLHVWAPFESQLSSSQVSELFLAKGCGLENCDILETAGWGMVRIGAEYESVRGAVKGNKFEIAEDFWCYISGESWPDGISASLNSRQQIDNIYIDAGSGVKAPNVRTEKGIKIGSTLTELKTAYPGAKPQREFDGQTDYEVRIGVLQKLMFRTFDGRVTSMGLGTDPSVEPDGCPAIG